MSFFIKLQRLRGGDGSEKPWPASPGRVCTLRRWAHSRHVLQQGKLSAFREMCCSAGPVPFSPGRLWGHVGLAGADGTSSWAASPLRGNGGWIWTSNTPHGAGSTFRVKSLSAHSRTGGCCRCQQARGELGGQPALPLPSGFAHGRPWQPWLGRGSPGPPLSHRLPGQSQGSGLREAAGVGF